MYCGRVSIMCSVRSGRVSWIVTCAWGFDARCRAAKERPIVPAPIRVMFVLAVWVAFRRVNESSAPVRGGGALRSDGRVIVALQESDSIDIPA